MNLQQNLPGASSAASAALTAVSAALASPSTLTPKSSLSLSPAGIGALPATGSTPRARAASPNNNPRTPKARTWSESQSANGGTPGSAFQETASSDMSGDAAVNSSGAGGIENVMDELMVQYLRKRGYHVASTSGSSNATRRGSMATSGGDMEMEDVSSFSSTARSPAARAGVKHELASNGLKGRSAGSPVSVESAGRGRPRASSDERRKFLGAASDDMRVDSSSDATTAAVTLEQYAQKLGLNTESCAANHIVRILVACVFVCILVSFTRVYSCMLWGNRFRSTVL